MTSPEPTEKKSDPSAGFRPGLILAFLCVGQFMVFLDLAIVNLALPSIQDSLGMSDVSLNYIVTAYATVLGGFLLLGGRLADTLGRRRMLQVGYLIFAAASLVSGFSTTGTMLIAARASQGLGAALMAPAALSILTNSYAEGAPRNKALGIWGSLTGLASIAGVILGGVLSDGPGWEWIFWINVPIGLAAAAVITRIVPESKAYEQRRSFDVAGAATLTAGMLLLIFTLGETTHVGWASARTIGGLAGVAVLFAVFILIELRATAPLVPLGIFRLQTMRTANLTAVLVWGVIVALFFFVSLFMQQVYGYSPMRSGFAYVPLALAVVTGAGVASGMITKLAARPVLMTGMVVMIAGLLLLWRAPSDGRYLVDLLPAFVLVGLGCGLMLVTLQIAAFVGLDDKEAGLGAGLINTSQEAGGALGLAVIATIAYTGISGKLTAAGGDPGLIREAQATANHQAFLTAACFTAAALLLALTLMPRGGAPKPAETVETAPGTRPTTEAEPTAAAAEPGLGG